MGGNDGKPNILLVVLDTIRASNTSLHGYHRSTTPFLSSFADKATVYYQARAPSVASLPSHVSMFTGYHTEQHLLSNDDHEAFRISAGATIWEQIKQTHGYQTGVFSSNPYLTMAPVGLKDAFDRVVSGAPWPFPSGLNPHDYIEADDREYRKFLTESLRSDAPVKSMTNGALMFANTVWPRWPLTTLRRKIDRAPLVESFLNWTERTDQWAACVNLMDAHEPYEPKPEHDLWSDAKDWEIQAGVEHHRWDFMSGKQPWESLEQLENIYDGGIRQADSKTERLISELESRGELDNTLVIITSDHGQAFGECCHLHEEQRLASHTVGVHDVLLHVPLLVREPNQTEPIEINDPVSLINLPTVIERAIADRDVTCALDDDTAVLATQLPLSDETIETASSRGVESPILSERLRAVFVKEGNRIIKYVSSGDRAVQFDIGSPEMTLEECDPGEVDQYFVGVEDVGIKERMTGQGEVDHSTRQRLSELGYLS